MRRDSEHIPFLDHIRGIAILLVFLFHGFGTTFAASYNGDQLRWNGWGRDLNGAPSSYLALLPVSFGWIGVAMFFVVSGFCIHLSYARSKSTSFGVFYLRRFFRLFPAYFVAVLFFALVMPFIFVACGMGRLAGATNPAEIFKQIAWHLTFANNFSDTCHWGLSGSFWSIAVEVQLYLLYPVLLWMVGRWGWTRALMVTAAIELGMRSLAMGQAFIFPNYSCFSDSNELIPFPVRFRESPLIFWFSWSIGAALAEAYLKGGVLPFRKYSLYLGPLAFLVCYSFKPLFPFCFTLAALSTVSLIAWLLERPHLNYEPKGLTGLALNHLRWAGVISYSLYLLHQRLLTFIGHALPMVFARVFHWQNAPSLVIFGGCVLFWFMLCGLAYGLHRLVELPGINLGKAVIQRLRRPKALPADSLPSEAQPD